MLYAAYPQSVLLYISSNGEFYHGYKWHFFTINAALCYHYGQPKMLQVVLPETSDLLQFVKYYFHVNCNCLLLNVN